MGQVLYRKYRSKSLNELVGQEHITQTLKTALERGKIAHAYLFTGPRGVGKTSVARILAHAINNLPYTDDQQHLDIIEIDAASNRRIDEIRDLRDRVHIAPVSAAYKVYIIDEVHMLTREAFNALLKTLEEPPAHVIFILATTEVQKLPETIISRTQRFSFHPVTEEQITKHLQMLAKKEHINIDKAALQLIAEHSDGSFRDSISLLDQAQTVSDHITLEEAQRLLGVAASEMIEQLIAAIAASDATSLVQTLEQIKMGGVEASILAKQLGKKLREQLVGDKPKLSSSQTLQLLQQLLNVPTARDPMIQLEICLLDSIFRQNPQPAAQSQPPSATPTPPPPVAPPLPKATPKPEPATIAEKPSVVEPSEVPKPKVTSSGPLEFDEATWAKVLDAMKKQYNTLYGIIRLAKPTIEDNELVLRSKFAFHQKRLNEAKNKKIVTDFFEAITGQAIVIRCIHEPDLEPGSVPVVTASVATSTETDSPLNAVSDIFGGGELLES